MRLGEVRQRMKERRETLELKTSRWAVTFIPHGRKLVGETKRKVLGVV